MMAKSEFEAVTEIMDLCDDLEQTCVEHNLDVDQTITALMSWLAQILIMESRMDAEKAKERFAALANDFGEHIDATARDMKEDAADALREVEVAGRA